MNKPTHARPQRRQAGPQKPLTAHQLATLEHMAPHGLPVPVRCHDGGYEFARVDAASYVQVSQYSWAMNDKGYPCTMVLGPDGMRHKVTMHRMVMGLPTGDPRTVDHTGFDHLDNRRAMLQVVTRAENSARTRNTTTIKTCEACNKPSPGTKHCQWCSWVLCAECAANHGCTAP